MLPLPELRTTVPSTIEEALEALARGGPRTRLLAGGTDLVPNLKHGLQDVDELVLLGGLSGLRGVRRGDEGSVRLGALSTLASLARDPALLETYPALAGAIGQIAGPQLRNMGTLGGNLCLDTRCTYYNQTEHWRRALGYCLKREGTVCHVVPGGTRCVAAVSSDAAPMIMALGGSVVVRSRERGEREIPLSKFFLGEGRKNIAVEADEMLIEARLPPPPAGGFAAYRKLRPRGAIDFPILSVAVAGTRAPDGTMKTARVVVSVLGAKPREVSGVAALVEGKAPSAQVFEAVAAAAFRQARPLTNVPIDPEWRHQMVPVLVRRALAEALS